MTIHCPRCGTAILVQPAIDHVTVYSVSTLLVTWDKTEVGHECPDPTRDREQ